MLKFAISDRTLLQFAELIACAVMLSQGHDVDEVGERRIEFLIDQLAPLRSLLTTGVQPPRRFSVFIITSEGISQALKLEELRRLLMIAEESSALVFDIRIFIVGGNGTDRAFRLPPALLKDGREEVTLEDLLLGATEDVVPKGGRLREGMEELRLLIAPKAEN